MKTNKIEFPVKEEEIYYLSKEEMERRVKKWYRPKWMARFIGGYCIPEDKCIYIKESRRNDIRLLNHERGHLMGYSHTVYPTLMASSWVYRWLNRYYPPYGRKGK